MHNVCTLLLCIYNGAELGGAIGAMAPLVFWSRSLKKSQKVSKSKSRSLEWHQLFLPSFGANVYITYQKYTSSTYVQPKNLHIAYSTYFCRFYGKVGAISWLHFHLIKIQVSYLSYFSISFEKITFQQYRKYLFIHLSRISKVNS